VPAWWERDSIILIGVSAMLILLGSIGYFILKKKLKQRFLLAKVRAASSYRAHIARCASGCTAPLPATHARCDAALLPRPPSFLFTRRRSDDDRARARRKRPLAVPAEAHSGTNKISNSGLT
jgi:hypothetical protein